MLNKKGVARGATSSSKQGATKGVTTSNKERQTRNVEKKINQQLLTTNQCN
jgi:hypothetical protein